MHLDGQTDKTDAKSTFEIMLKCTAVLEEYQSWHDSQNFSIVRRLSLNVFSL